jgi:uracil-DNA glycosylase
VLEYAGYFLDVPAKDVFKQCVYTNLVKCSTTGERDRLHPQTQQACFCRHFQREVVFFNPRAIVAFGREAYRFLVHPTIYSVHHKPVVYVKHPSYPYSKAKKDNILASIKSELKEYC